MASDKAFWQWIEERAAAKARLKADRRKLLKGAGAGAPPWRPAPALRQRPPRGAQEAPHFEGVTLRVFTQTGPFISGPVKFHAPEFKELYGATVETIEVPSADLFPRAQQAAQTGSGDFDILLLANTWMPDFVNLEYADLRCSHSSTATPTMSCWPGTTSLTASSARTPGPARPTPSSSTTTTRRCSTARTF